MEASQLGRLFRMRRFKGGGGVGKGHVINIARRALHDIVTPLQVRLDIHWSSVL